MAWAVLSVIALHSMLEYPLWYGPFQIALLLSLWILWRRDPAPCGHMRRMTAHSSALAAVVLIAATAYAGRDYHRISQIYLNPAQRLERYRENTLEKISDSRLFRDTVSFARLTTSDLTLGNAAEIHTLAEEMLHFSPEPRVIEKLIESATLLGHTEEALFYLQRYRAAFEQAYAHWAKENATLQADDLRLTGPIDAPER